MVKHVVWDWNGTLVDDVALCVDILNHALLIHGKKETNVETYRNTFFFPVAKFYKTLGLPSYGESYCRLSENYIQEYRNRFKECTLHLGAEGIIEELDSMGISQSVLSAGKQEDIEHFISFYGLNNRMSLIDGANNIEAKGKEDRALQHLEELGLDPMHALLVGDSLHDWDVAKLIGCKVLLFEQGHISPSRLKKVPAQRIKSLVEVSKWVHD